MSEFYVTEERAMAPGIAGEWPRIIPKPDNQHGRLVKVDGLRELLVAADSELSAIAHGRPPSDKQTLLDLSNRLRAMSV